MVDRAERTLDVPGLDALDALDVDPTAGLTPFLTATATAGPTPGSSRRSRPELGGVPRRRSRQTIDSPQAAVRNPSEPLVPGGERQRAARPVASPVAQRSSERADTGVATARRGERTSRPASAGESDPAISLAEARDRLRRVAGTTTSNIVDQRAAASPGDLESLTPRTERPRSDHPTGPTGARPTKLAPTAITAEHLDGPASAPTDADAESSRTPPATLVHGKPSLPGRAAGADSRTYSAPLVESPTSSSGAASAGTQVVRERVDGVVTASPATGAGSTPAVLDDATTALREAAYRDGVDVT